MNYQISTISDEEMNSMREAADLALRGITFPRCTQVQRPSAAPATPEQGFWGRVNGQETDLDATLKRAVK